MTIKKKLKPEANQEEMSKEAPSRVPAGVSAAPGGIVQSKVTQVPTKTIPIAVRFLVGACAGVGATLVVQPLDLVKTRMQVSGEGGGKKMYSGPLNAISQIVRKEGITGMYTGLSAAVLRQMTYTQTRFGIYTTLMAKYANEDGTPPGFASKLAFGATAGACGSVVGNPAGRCLLSLILLESSRFGSCRLVLYLSLFMSSLAAALCVLCRSPPPTHPQQ